MIDFDFTIVRRNRRKTASISVSPENRVTITVPDYLSDDRIMEIIERKSRWIRKRIADNPGRVGQVKPREYISGETFKYLGKTLLLQVKPDVASNLSLEGDVLVARIPWKLDEGRRRDYIAARVEEWYRSRAVETLVERVRLHEKLVGKKVNTIRVKDLSSRWGSCSIRGNLNFNWKIIIAPVEILDYVVIHELCHLIHLDHSPRFWGLVQSILPDYALRRKWLRAHGPSLELSNG